MADLFEAIIDNDGDALEAALRERGFIRAEDLEAQTAARRQTLDRTGEILRENPDLNNAESALYREVARQVETLTADPEYAELSEVALLKVAVRTAKSTLAVMDKPKAKTKPDEAEPRHEAKTGNDRAEQFRQAMGVSKEAMTTARKNFRGLGRW